MWISSQGVDFFQICTNENLPVPYIGCSYIGHSVQSYPWLPLVEAQVGAEKADQALSSPWSLGFYPKDHFLGEGAKAESSQASSGTPVVQWEATFNCSSEWLTVSGQLSIT